MAYNNIAIGSRNIDDACWPYASNQISENIHLFQQLTSVKAHSETALLSLTGTISQ